MRMGFYGSIFVLVLLTPLAGNAGEVEQTPSAIEEIKQLQLRTEALEKKLPEAKPSAPAAPTVRAGSAYMNVSFDVLANAGWSSTPDAKELQPGDHDPSQRGFSLRNAELALDGAVDPYLKGFANIVFKTDASDDTEIELEEAYLLSTSLPAGLQIKAGRFFAEFGRQNAQHPHTWAFVDEPLVLNRMFGSDGLRQNGVRFSWLAPTPNYLEFILGVFNGQGGDASSFRFQGEAGADGVERVYGRATKDRLVDSVGDLLYVPRISSSFDLTDSQTLVLGASAAFGPNDTGGDARTSIYGADVYWKWKSPRAEGGWPFLTWQTEVLERNFQAGADLTAGLPAETLHDWGLSSQIQWGWARRWTLGLRGEYVTGDGSASVEPAAERSTETRFSPDVTWYPSEFSKFRLQYNHEWREHAREGNAVWLQVEFMLGAHAAHKF